jgi:glutamate synthase (NADPH/NADH) small chain
VQNFIKVDRLTPEKVDVISRLKNFSEVYRVFDPLKAGVQAERCVQCGDPYCSACGCPLSNYIPHWLKAIAESDLQLAFKLSNESSPFPEILGRICPQDRLCEGSCTLGQDGYGSITIGSIETAITENGFEAGYDLPLPPARGDKKVAIIGSGPASLSCATFLMRAGISVEMFEKSDRPGGLLTYGIPGFKLDKAVVQRRFDRLQGAGLVLHLNHAIESEEAIKKLQKGFDAIFVGVGASKATALGIEGEQGEGVYDAMTFLTAVQKGLFESSRDERFDFEEKRVVVIGGGDTAMDCVRTALRLGARSVTCAYRRNEAAMPGSKKEFINAKEEGGEFLFHHTPKAFEIQGGQLAGIHMAKTELKDDGKRGKLVEVEGSEHTLKADIVLLALGFNHQPMPWLQKLGAKLNQWGGIETDAHNQSSIDGLYAGGDCVRGADLAVSAAKDGKIAALRIIERLLA